MKGMLNQDIASMPEWDRVNRVDFNARKSQHCLLTYGSLFENIASSVIKSDIDIRESEVLEVSKEAFKCLGF